MYIRLKLIFNVTLVVGVQLIALGIVGTVTGLAVSSNSQSHFSTAINQGYQPPSTIGSPISSLGSGTR